MENRPKIKRDPLVSCFVPACKNTVLMCPGKLFVFVPKSTRSEWCSAVNKVTVPTSAVYICEDHLNLEEDLMNYEAWINGNAQRPRLKPQVPRTLRNIGLCELPSTSSVRQPETECFESICQQKDKGVLCKPQYCHKSVQVNPVMVHRCVSVNVNALKRKQLILVEETSDQSSSPFGSTVEFTETETGDSTVQCVQEFTGRKFILTLIRLDPFDYIGITKQYYWIIEYIAKASNIPSFHIILTLYKLKNNDTFKRMKELFEVSIATLWRMFFKTVKLLSLFFKQFIYWPSKLAIKLNLPPAFQCNAEYSSVQTIIDAFEIEIEKPKKPIEQTLSWSQYKHCNTVKYLIGSTPDGFINFISEGYGGRISDMNLIEQSGFLETVPENATILADRGFKHLETHLLKKSVKVLRPPSVIKDKKMTKSEVLDTKVIASLRIHIERVIRRVRLFKILKPHSVVNNKLVNVLDHAVIIAYGLINMQAPIIRKYLHLFYY